MGVYVQYFNKQNKLHLKTIKLVEESKYLNIHNEEMEGYNELTVLAANGCKYKNVATLK